jgi:alkylresorcinol/alkylpyrone synthase
MRIASVASAYPKHRHSQSEILAVLKDVWAGQIDKPQYLDRLHSRVGVDYRYTALPLEAYRDLDKWGKANNAWIDTAVNIGSTAICRATSGAGISPQELAAFFFVSITGIASPSVDARLINKMGLSPNIKRMPIFGLGCVGGAAGISRAADYVRAYPDQFAVLLSVELCSLTLQREDVSMANIISSGLFGDGAAAVIIAGDDAFPAGPEILATKSVFYPDTQDVMGWDISEKGFRIVLSRDVPKVAREHLRHDVDEFLDEQGLTRADIGSWIMHTGGPAVLEATQEALELPDGALDASWECLRRTGNLSSTSVLLVLEEVMSRRRPEPGTYSILAAMGPGFCSEFVLLRW